MPSQRFSYQREQIYETVCTLRTHPTAEMVYHRLKPALPRLSLGTVYRNLHQMAQEGRLTELDGPTIRFDADTAPHAHLQCNCCGGLYDLEEFPYDEGLNRRAETGGCVITGHTLLFNGLCPACAGHDKKQNDL